MKRTIVRIRTRPSALGETEHAAMRESVADDLERRFGDMTLDSEDDRAAIEKTLHRFIQDAS